MSKTKKTLVVILACALVFILPITAIAANTTNTDVFDINARSQSYEYKPLKTNVNYEFNGSGLHFQFDNSGDDIFSFTSGYLIFEVEYNLSSDIGSVDFLSISGYDKNTDYFYSKNRGNKWICGD